MGGRHRTGWSRARVFALGHSTRTFDELRALLEEHGIAVLADIRTVPRSRRNPQFNREVLDAALSAFGIVYVHVPQLGGLRKARADSPNTAWRNSSFRGYADHMLTDEFAEGLERIRVLSRQGPVALMCAEAVPWRCHRSLVADALSARGVEVTQIFGPGQQRPHRVTPFARIEGRSVTYPEGA